MECAQDQRTFVSTCSALPSLINVDKYVDLPLVDPKPETVDKPAPSEMDALHSSLFPRKGKTIADPYHEEPGSDEDEEDELAINELVVAAARKGVRRKQKRASKPAKHKLGWCRRVRQRKASPAVTSKGAKLVSVTVTPSSAKASKGVEPVSSAASSSSASKDVEVESVAPSTVVTAVRAVKGARFHSRFGPFQINTLWSKGVQKGCSLICGRHVDADNADACSADCSFGAGGLTQDEVILRLKRWALKGYLADGGLIPRYNHMRVLGPARKCSEPLTPEERDAVPLSLCHLLIADKAL